MTDMAELVRDQFRLPRGPLGRVAGWVMSSRASNRARSRWTVDLLDLCADAQVLEVGYGPGLGIEAAVRTATRGHVVGLDHSPVMRAAAGRRNAAAIRAGTAELLVGDAQDPRLDPGTFDAVYGCNVALFWSDPALTFSRLARLLRPGGRLAITHQPRGASVGPSDAAAAADQLEAWLLQAGLVEPHQSRLELRPAPAICVLAHAPGQAA